MPTLADIRTKVRRITRSPADAQITDAQIDEYVNTFILYDLPQMNQIFDLRKTLTFYTRAFIGEYPTTPNLVTDATNPLYDFKNRYISILNPVYIGGFPGVMAQSRELFYTMYPQQCYIAALPFIGDGIVFNFTGILPYRPVMEGFVTFSATYIDPVTTNYVTMALRDKPILSFDGLATTTGLLYTPDDLTTPRGQINYVTGQYQLVWPNPPGAGLPINAEVVPYVAARPYSVLYYNDTFFLRPIPNYAYSVTFDVQVVPTALLNSTDHPEIDQWWQYIAYGASKKVFEDRMDLDSVQMIMPEMLNQETLSMRKTITQQSTQRSATIYNQPMNYRYGYGWGSDWGMFIHIGFILINLCSFISIGI